MSTIEKVSVRLTSETISLLQALVDKGKYSSVSDAILDAISTLISDNYSSAEISRVLMDATKIAIGDISSLMKDRNEITLDDAVRQAVRDYVRSKMDSEE